MFTVLTRVNREDIYVLDPFQSHYLVSNHDRPCWSLNLHQEFALSAYGLDSSYLGHSFQVSDYLLVAIVEEFVSNGNPETRLHRHLTTPVPL